MKFLCLCFVLLIFITGYFYFKNDNDLYTLKSKIMENPEHLPSKASSKLDSKKFGKIKERELQTNLSDNNDMIESADAKARELAMEEIDKLAELEKAHSEDVDSNFLYQGKDRNEDESNIQNSSNEENKDSP